MNHDIVRGKVNKSLKHQRLSLGVRKTFSLEEGNLWYHLDLPLQSGRRRVSHSFTYFPEDPRTRVDISSGSASRSGGYVAQECSVGQYCVGQYCMMEGARAVTTTHGERLLRRSIALDCFYASPLPWTV